MFFFILLWLFAFPPGFHVLPRIFLFPLVTSFHMLFATSLYFHFFLRNGFLHD